MPSSFFQDSSAIHTPSPSGVHFERRIFHSTFATQDQKEGMKAFVEKSQPKWNHS